MVWKQPLCHTSDCYFCLSKKTGFGRSIKWEYAQVSSVMFPVARQVKRTVEDVHMMPSECSDSDFEPTTESNPLSQAELSIWVRDLELPKHKAELLGSYMRQRGFLKAGVKITAYRNRHEQYAKFFVKKNEICY